MSNDLSIGFAYEQCILPVLCYLCGKVDGICKLEDNLVELRRNFNDLIAKRDGVLNRVKAEELKGRLRLPVVANWLSEVQTIETNTNQLFIDASAQEATASDALAQDAPAQEATASDALAQDAPAQEALVPEVSDAPTQPSQDAESQDVSASDAHQRQSAFAYWSKNIISTYSLAEKVLRKLNDVRNLSFRGVFEVVTQQAPPPMVEVRPYQQTFGLTTTLEKTWKSLMDDETRMLGIYGMGGIGKTTLLTLINNKFVDFKDDFDVVIWVKVSKDADIEKIQDKIGKRTGLYDENWCTYSKTEKAEKISTALMKNRFVLLLDDLWEKLSLSDIGIPLQAGESKYKVMFTTRSMGVCGRMGANVRIEVKCLGSNDAWDLFKHKVSEEGLKGELSELARNIAVRCRGLPLVLEVIGGSMSSRGRNAAIWRRAITTLNSSLAVFEGVEKEIFKVLKLSYDNLEKEDAKLCFRYCALFPEAYSISQDELVKYWIGEGSIIDEEDGRQTAKDRGSEIINTLVGAGLLLVDDESKQKVYMHDMIREMALWIVSKFESGERFFLKAGARLNQLPEVKNWRTVMKMSLMNNEIKSIPDDLEFPDLARLITLFLQNNKLETIVVKFFMVMSTLLVVLDLSHNHGITELPEYISNLGSLRYLSLLGTCINVLPSGFEKLGRLIHLDLESTPSLKSIRLSGLSNLQVLRFYDSAALDLHLLKLLERLEGLDLLTITVRENDVLIAFLGSNVAGYTHGLYLEGLDEVSGVSGRSFAATFGGTLGSLSKLEMTECNIIESESEWEEGRRHQYSPSTSSNQNTPSNTWFKNLSYVVISSCEHLKDLTWLIYAANLESLRIESSPKVEEVISKRKASSIKIEPFQKLEVLHLNYLVELKSIYWSPLSFLKLHQVHITKCPNLCKLPLNSESAERINDLCIKVEEEWLHGVEWESGAKERFLPVIRTASVPHLHQV